jgi:hypothetical protein
MRDPAVGRETIHRWVAVGEPEGLYLDFTTKKDPEVAALDIDDRRGFAKALSGFANSDGGLFVWGVDARRDEQSEESPDIARRPIPIANVSAFLTNLDHFIFESTKPPVAGVRNILVHESVEQNTGYVVTLIPAGSNPPYRAERCGNNFYHRVGSQFRPMEPYQIRDVVFRFRYPKIELNLTHRVQTSRPPGAGGEMTRSVIRIEIVNHGPTALRDYKVVLTVPKGMCDPPRSSVEPVWRAVPAPDTGDGGVQEWVLYSAEADRDSLVVVYPGERKQIGAGGAALSMKLDGYLWANVPDTAVARCRLLGTDMPPIVVEKHLHEMRD